MVEPISTDASVPKRPELAELKQTGSTILRGAWSLDHLAELRRAILCFIEWRTAMIARGVASESHAHLHQLGAGLGNTLIGSGYLKMDLLLTNVLRESLL